MNLAVNEPVIYIERVRFADGVPMSLNISVLPHWLVPRLEDEDVAKNSLYELIEHRYGLVLSRAEQTLEPILAPPEIAHFLKVKTGSPLLLISGVVYLKNDTPIEWLRIWYRGDRYKFHLTAVR